MKPDELYTRQEAMRRARIGNNTWSAWIHDGLTVCKRGSAVQYVWGADLIAFIRGEKPDAKASKARTR